MNNPLKKLASETAIYGITHSLGRFLNFLLVPLYTRVFPVEEYGAVNVYYSLFGFAIVLLLYGMETAFFNFARNNDPKRTFSTALNSIAFTTVIFIVLGISLKRNIANFLEYPDQANFVIIFVFIIALDALSTLPLAWLRFEKRPLRFGIVRLTNIVVNIGLNLAFLLLFPWLIKLGYNVPFYEPKFGIGYIFVANLVASLVSLIMLLPQWSMVKFGFDKKLLKRMLTYAQPLIWVGLAGIVNETLDRVLLKKLLANEIADYQVGVYSAFYKLSIIMTLAVQSFRFAAEPFFFDHSKEADAKKTYARVMHYFVIILCGIFLATAIFAEQIGHIFIRRAEYFDHPHWRYLVPILLLANLFLGITYNLNIWYKLNNKTKLGMNISLAGAAITLTFNFILIPYIGILGSAITTLIAYVSMAVMSYLMGRKHYPVPYNLRIIGFYITLTVALYAIFEVLRIRFDYSWPMGLLLILTLVSVVFYLERPAKKP